MKRILLSLAFAIAAGGAQAQTELFFRRDTTGLWEELIERLGNGHAPRRGRGFQSASL